MTSREIHDCSAYWWSMQTTTVIRTQHNGFFNGFTVRHFAHLKDAFVNYCMNSFLLYKAMIKQEDLELLFYLFFNREEKKLSQDAELRPPHPSIQPYVF